MATLKLTTPGSRKYVEAVTEGGKIVKLSYKSYPHILVGLAGKPIGHPFEAEISEYNGATLVENNFAMERQYAELATMFKKDRVLDLQIAKLEKD